MSKERWKPLPNNSSYFVSTEGRLYSTKVNRVLNINARRDGYCKTMIYFDGRPKNVSLHSLVMQTFVGPRPEGSLIRHLDGDSTNNKLSNLVYGNAKENAMDTIRTGNHQWSKRDSCSKGHKYTKENTYVWRRNGRPRRLCRECNRFNQRQYEMRKNRVLAK